MKIKSKFLLIMIIIFISTNSLFYNNIYAESDTSTSEQASESDNSTSNYMDTSPEANNLSLNSPSAILIDAKTGKVLIAKNENEQRYPASITKVLTAIIAIEKYQLTDKLTASYNAVMSLPSGYSNAAIQPGETFTVQEYLDMFLIQSANEVGFIFAENISGSVENFANLMNQKATELGCTNSHFTNPSGVHDVNHYSTAHDMALIAKYCMQNETFRSIVSKTSCKIAATDKYEERYFRNTNDLINPYSKCYYEYAIGIKTGYTSQAKKCLIAGALKDNLELIAVFLGADVTENQSVGRYADAINLFNWGFANYKWQEVVSQNSVIKDVTVKKATKDTKNLSLIINNSINSCVPVDFDINNLNFSVDIPENITAPIAEGSVIGKVLYNIDGIDYSCDLVASHNVEKSNFVIIIVQIALAIIVLIFLAKMVSLKNNNKKKPRKKYKYKKNKFDSIYRFQ